MRHATGLYLGTALSNAKYLDQPADPTRQEVDLLAGYRFRIAALAADLGFANYTYLPSPQAGAARLLQYQGATLRLSHGHADSGLSGEILGTLDLFEGGFSSAYGEAGIGLKLLAGLRGVVTLGYQQTVRNPRVDVPSYLWYGIALQREFGPVTAALGWFDTTIRQAACAPVPERASGGQRICAGRVLLSVSWSF